MSDLDVDYSDPALLDSDHAREIREGLDAGDTPADIIEMYEPELGSEMARLLVTETVTALTAQGHLTPPTPTPIPTSEPSRGDVTMATVTKSNSAQDLAADLRSGELIAEFVNIVADGEMAECDMLSNAAISLEPRLIARLRAAGLDDPRFLGMGSTAQQSARSVTRHFKVAAELQEQAAKAMKKAWQEYQRNVREPVLRAQQKQPEFEV